MQGSTLARLKGKFGKKNYEKDLARSILFVSYYFNYKPEEVIKMPIKKFNLMVEFLEKDIVGVPKK